MSFKAFVQQGWQDHGKDAEAVFGRLDAGLALAADAGELAALAQLGTHVAGEHLGKWSDGAAFLGRVAASPHFTAESTEGKAVYRSLAVLHFCGGEQAEADRLLGLAEALTGKDTEASNQTRFWAAVAAALAGQRRSEEAAAAFHSALAAAAYGPAKDDPAARALAITANNLAAAAEEQAERTPAETALMLSAAATARHFWEVAGTWVEVERAEYRLAMAHSAAADHAGALVHANNCLAICEAHTAPAFETFFAYEALARVQHAAGNAAAARAAHAAAGSLVASLDAADKPYAAEVLAALDRRLSAP